MQHRIFHKLKKHELRTHSLWKLPLSVFVLCLVLGQAGMVFANEAEKTPAASTAEELETSQTYKLPTITITADKRETDVQKTPTAVTVMTDIDLEDANIDTVEKVMMRIPNLNVSKNITLNNMSFRGIPTSAASSTNPLIMYIDGVPTDTYYNLDAPLLDIERVEVLRGAQSAMYGKNAMGGVINIISRKPDNDWRTALNFEYGSYNAQTYSALVSGPIIEDRLAFSVAGSYKSSDGYMDRPDTKKSNAEEAARFKGQLRFTPTDSTEFNLHANYTSKRDGFFNQIVGITPTLDSIENPDDKLDIDSLNLALTASTAFDSFIAESVTTYRNETIYFENDLGWTQNAELQNGGTTIFPYSFPVNSADSGRDVSIREFSQEFRMKSPDDKSGLVWLVGLFGAYTDHNNESIWTRAEYTTPDTITFPGLGTFPFPPDYISLDQPSRQYTEDYALFAEATYPVTEAFKITAALRGQYTKKDIHIEVNQNLAMQTPSDPLTNNATYDEEESWTELLPKLTLTYELADNAMVYAGVNRSFLPGGFNYVVAGPGQQVNFDSQTSWNYEIGTKTEWFDKRFLVNLVAFYSDIEDLQIFAYNPATTIYTTNNAGSVASYGIELDAQVRIFQGLDAEFAFGYTHAEFDEYTKDLGNAFIGSNIIDYSGNRTPYTPEYTATFALQYRHTSGIFARGEVLRYGSLYWDESNDYERPPVTLLNGRIGYEFDEFGIYLYANNLTDEKYLDYYVAPPFNVGNMARPREIGSQITYRF